jgi:hypothetical protein
LLTSARLDATNYARAAVERSLSGAAFPAHEMRQSEKLRFKTELLHGKGEPTTANAECSWCIEEGPLKVQYLLARM